VIEQFWYVQHTIDCMNAHVYLMSFQRPWSTNEAIEVLTQCAELRSSIRRLEEYAKQVLETDQKVLPFVRPDKKTN
jgi:hypothetical protein